jgi:acylphosphatase
MNEDHARLHATIHGRVQGVNFRYYTQREASNLHITGWIYNRPDGSVEVVAEGKKESLQKLRQFLHRGPPSARVEHVEAEWGESTGEFNRFRVRHFR